MYSEFIIEKKVLQSIEKPFEVFFRASLENNPSYRNCFIPSRCSLDSDIMLLATDFEIPFNPSDKVILLGIEFTIYKREVDLDKGCMSYHLSIKPKNL